MAYIGSSNVEALNTALRPRDEFVASGVQNTYLLAQEIPGGYESNIFAVIDNVPQEPITAYSIVDIYRLTLANGVIKQIRNVTIAKPTLSPAIGVTNYSSNTSLTTSVSAFLNPTGVNAANTILLQQRNKSTNTLIAEITVNKTDSYVQPGIITGVLNSGTFVVDDNNTYIIFRINSTNSYWGLNPSGITNLGNTLPTTDFERYYSVSSLTSEFESPKVADKINNGSGTTGIIVNATSSYIDVYTLTGTLTVSGTNISYFEPKSVNYDTDVITYENESSGTFQIAAITPLRFRGIKFNGVPESGQKIYISHLGGSNYQVLPAVGSVTDLSLAENLKTFTVDKFVSTQNQQNFILSKSPVSVQSILVTVNGVVQTDTSGYTLQNQNELVLASPLNSGVSVNVLHLGFSTVSRNSFVDGAIGTLALQDLSVTTAKIANNSVTNAKLASGAAIANIGYTPHNPTSVSPQTYAGSLTIAGNLTTNGQIVFPGTQNASAAPNTLDDYEEGDWVPSLLYASGSGLATSVTIGKYIKIGRLVHLTGQVILNNLGSASGVIKFGNLPFEVNSSGSTLPDYGILFATSSSFTWTGVQLIKVLAGTTTIGIMNNSTDATIANLTAGSNLSFTITYVANN